MNAEYVVFIRFSLNGDKGALLGRLRNCLEQQGFSRVGTSAYEKRGVPQSDTGRVLAEFWQILENPRAVCPNATLASNVHVDHVWTYVGLTSPVADDGEFVVVDDTETFEVVDDTRRPPAQ